MQMLDYGLVLKEQHCKNSKAMLTDQTLENSWKLLLPMANLKRTEITNKQHIKFHCALKVHCIYNVFENVHLHVHG